MGNGFPIVFVSRTVGLEKCIEPAYSLATKGSTLYLIAIQQHPQRPLRLGAFRLGLNLRHPSRGYAGTPRNLGNRFVHYSPR